jgi:hypothetical protein
VSLPITTRWRWSPRRKCAPAAWPTERHLGGHRLAVGEARGCRRCRRICVPAKPRRTARSWSCASHSAQRSPKLPALLGVLRGRAADQRQDQHGAATTKGARLRMTRMWLTAHKAKLHIIGCRCPAEHAGRLADHRIVALQRLHRRIADEGAGQQDARQPTARRRASRRPAGGCHSQSSGPPPSGPDHRAEGREAHSE